MLKTIRKEIRVALLSIRYSIMREMLNKVTFISNIVFMFLNNATFILEWVVLFSIRDDIGGYGFNEVMLIWGFAAGTFGISHVFFAGASRLSDFIINGELDAYLVQPKDVLLSAITSSCDVSAIGDLIYALVMIFVYGFSWPAFLLYIVALVCGGLIFTSTQIIAHSLSFWFGKVDIITDTINSTLVNFSTYPGTVFKGWVKLILYTIVPVGLAVYMPADMVIGLDLNLLGILLILTALFVFLSYNVFNIGLKKYSSTNLMNARV
jgi:ABC-2 type transport system permease protein